MIIDVVYDSSVNSAPLAFTTAVNSAVNFLEDTFLDNVTITINVGFGTVQGKPLDFGALGESVTWLSNFTYQQIKTALAADAKSADDANVVASLPANDPTNGGYWVTNAEAKAIGLQIVQQP